MNIAALLAPEWLRAQTNTEDPRVAEVLAGTIGIDMHNHVVPGGQGQSRVERSNRSHSPTLS
jgi:hypothetical protein